MANHDAQDISESSLLLITKKKKNTLKYCDLVTDLIWREALVRETVKNQKENLSLLRSAENTAHSFAVLRAPGDHHPLGKHQCHKLYLQAATKVLRGHGGEGEETNCEELSKSFWL